MSIHPEYDNVPVLSVDLTEWEQWWLLTALHNDFLTQLKSAHAAGFASSDQFNEQKLGTITMFEHALDLVRKLGGNPDHPTFGAQPTPEG